MKLLGISGSLRQASFNRKLLREAARLTPNAVFTKADLNMPLYDGDLETAEGLPQAVTNLVAQIAAADGVVISTPEYNKGISGVLKNALDWVSRADGNPWLNKPVAIISATAGRGGGERAQTMVQNCMAPFSPQLVLGKEVLVGQVSAQFGDNDRLTNDRYEAGLSALMARLAALSGV